MGNCCGCFPTHPSNNNPPNHALANQSFAHKLMANCCGCFPSPPSDNNSANPALVNHSFASKLVGNCCGVLSTASLENNSRNSHNSSPHSAQVSPAHSLEMVSQPIIQSASTSHTDQSSSPHSLELVIRSMRQSIETQGSAQNIDFLIEFIDHMISKIQALSEHGATTSSSEIHLETVAGVTRGASQIIDLISKEANQFKQSELAKGLGRMTLKVVKLVGESHWIFLGLSMTAYAMERCITVRSNEADCNELLEKIGHLAKDIKKLRETVPRETERLSYAIQVIVEGTFLCCHFMSQGGLSRLFHATGMQAQLEKTAKSIHDITSSLTLTVVAGISRQYTRYVEQSSVNLLDIKPEGIEERVAQVKEMVDLEGSEAVAAVILWGFGGIGKSVLASAAIQELDCTSKGFKFCMVIIDDKRPEDRTSHILKLQKDIVNDFGGGKLDLRNTKEGRQQVQNVVRNKRCFLFIDNVVDSWYIQELLPRKFLQSEENIGSAQVTKEARLRIVITSRQNNIKHFLSINKLNEYNVDPLSDTAAKVILHKIILDQGTDGDGQLNGDFDEEGYINAIADSCKGIPLLLSVSGSYLKVERKRTSYEKVLKALREGDFDRFDTEGNLSEKLLFVYDRMRDREAKEAFLDICTYFHGWAWEDVSVVVDSDNLEVLHKGGLVKLDQSGKVIVHDILRLMGRKVGRETRATNYSEFSAVLHDENRLKNMKGVALTNHSSLATIESTHLNAMSHSLRVLWLGDWVSINGPCDSEFTNLRYLQVGDVAGFPFSNASKMERLTYYHNKSNTGMDFAQLPRTLKTLQYEVPYAAWDEFTTPRLDNLKALKSFLVGSRKPLNLVQGFKLPASLERLSLAGCRKLPETFGHLTNLESLNLNECDFKSLPEGFGRLARLEYLYMECCTCLESLPANFGRLTALRSLHIRGCENLRTLPENFGNLSYLRDLDIRGCVSLQHFPESFSMLSLKFLNLESLLSLEELPESIGNMMSLSVLVIKTCNSLTNLPSSFVNLQMLKFLTIYNCMNLSSFPEDFGQLSSLTHMTVKNCPLLSELPDGFGALPALKVLGLKICRNFVNLSAGFGELHYLEKLYLNSLSFSSLPMGFGELKKLRILAINNAFRLETLPDDIENLVSLRNLHLVLCPMLDGAAMERIVKMQQCSSACIAGSQKLIERWTEIKKEEDYPVAVWTTTQKSLFGKDEDDMDWQRAAKVALFNLNCKELSATSEELMDRSSIAIDMEISVVVISLPLHLQSHHEVPLKNMCELAMRRSSTASSGQLQIIVFLPRAEFDEQRVSAEVEEEEERIIKALLWLPKGSCAIPVADTRRRFLVKELFFRSYLEENQLACFMADLRVQDNGQMLLKDGETIRENDISEKLSETDQKSESEDLETQLPDELQDFFKNVCNSESVLSPRPAEASIFKMLAQLLKRNGIHNYIDCNTLRKISVDELQGKDVCFIICGTSILQHRNTQLFYNFHNLNFQGVWIPISNSEKYGIGTCIRTCAHMSLRALLPPIAMEDIEENNGHFILLNRDGKMISRAPLSLVMSWGIQSYPFGKDQVNNIISRLSGNSALDFILEDMDIINHRGDKVEMQMIKNRLIFLYSEPPAHKLQMKCRFDQLEQVHQYFPVLYIGHSSSMKQTDMEAYEKLYEVVTKEMYWLKLPFWDMLKFWNRCKYLSSNFAEKLNLPFTLPKLVKQLFIEERWLVFLDSDGVITGSGREVMDIICKSYDENRDDIDIVMKDELLKYNLFSEKCTRIVQTYFNDEIFSHPNHPQHPLSLAAKQGRRFCDVCYVVFKDKSLCHQRTYSCKGCGWDLCKDCWKVYAKSQVQRMLL